MFLEPGPGSVDNKSPFLYKPRSFVGTLIRPIGNRTVCFLGIGETLLTSKFLEGHVFKEN